MGLAPTLGQQPRSRGLCSKGPGSSRSLLNGHIPHALASGDSALGFSRFTSAVLRESPVGFFSSAYLYAL
ncbi:hypothetical protein JTE90_015714 [Oedothorax gibbosus]|uniref:Uncharacterized protein n=1 Tax=Oedothorax gibbosus TaxID=931172 RepID=A0AAV6TI10_9ARAC|nr:hypothetical protein JTE90_015714 [Oedothorax gibbosus]